MVRLWYKTDNDDDNHIRTAGLSSITKYLWAYCLPAITNQCSCLITTKQTLIIILQMSTGSCSLFWSRSISLLVDQLIFWLSEESFWDPVTVHGLIFTFSFDLSMLQPLSFVPTILRHYDLWHIVPLISNFRNV